MGLLTAVVLVITFLKFGTCLDSTTLQYANYGEPCTKITDCDSSAYLTCIQGSCQCALSTSMTFDDASSSCYVLPGEKCIYKSPDIGLIASLESDERRSDRLSFRCVSNAACEDGFCTCLSGYFPTGNGTCERQHENEEACKADAECRSSLHLVCNSNGKCGCNETHAVFDTEHGLCVGKAGSSCFDFELCTANAYCPSFGIFNQYDVKCTCKSGHFETPDRTCEPRKGYQGSCKTTQECRDDLSLICDKEGTCGCNMTTHVYDSADGKCAALVGSACAEDQNCVANADCQHSGFLNGAILARNRVCKCVHGYFDGENRTCVRKGEHDSRCGDDSQCKEEFKLHCNRVTGRCACNETTHTYDRSRKKCMGFAGSHCERNEQCVINSVCRSPGFLYPRQYPKAECMCKDGFSKSVDGYCLGKFGSKCETWTSSCMANLSCKSGECVCPFGRDRQFYDFSMEQCVTLLNSPCDNETTQCVSNAYCGNRLGGSFCMCKAGFTTLDSDRCLATVGEKCSQGEHSYVPCVPNAKCVEGFCQCTNDHFVTNGTCERRRGYGESCSSAEECEDAFCDLQGTCRCNASTSVYDPVRKLCIRLAGAKCHDLRECVPNAMCRGSGRLGVLVEKEAMCICKEGYFQAENGTCEFKRSFGETCAANQECQDAADLMCSVHGRCECNLTTSLYDDSRRTCLRLAGAPCSSHQHCISHAKCRNPLYWVHFDSFSLHATCECEKELGYTNSSDGRCIIDYYGGSCDNTITNSCSSKFICEEGRCVCPYEDHQIYDVPSKNCLGLVKAPCDNRTNLCVKNSHCVATDEEVMECRCKHGFISVDRQCELTFGQSCSHRNDNSSDDARCDRLGPLRCVQGTCQCGGFQYYDYEMQKCRGLLGSRCDPEVKDFCTEGAFCEMYRGIAPKKYGRCRCIPGFNAEDNRTCTRVL